MLLYVTMNERLLKPLPANEDFQFSYGNSNIPVMRDSLELRRDCVVEWGWRPKSHVDDRDRYDNSNDYETYTAVKYTQALGERAIGASMRATVFEDPRETLSIEMLGSNGAMMEEALTYMNNAPTPQNGKLFDITRLVTDRELRKSGLRNLIEVIELLGYMHGRIAEDPHQGDDTWYYLTTLPLLNMLNRSGFTTEVITQGKVSAHDEEDSVFCKIVPAEAVRNSGLDPKTKLVHKHVNIGIDQAMHEKALGY